MSEISRRHFIWIGIAVPFIGKLLGDVKPVVPVNRYIPEHKRLKLELMNQHCEPVDSIIVSVDDFKVVFGKGHESAAFCCDNTDTFIFPATTKGYTLTGIKISNRANVLTVARTSPMYVAVGILIQLNPGDMRIMGWQGNNPLEIRYESI